MSNFEGILSPLWRMGLYGCKHLQRLQVNSPRYLEALKCRLDKILTDAGLDLIGAGALQYSEVGSHGYTYHTALLQSGAMIHTYPETGVVTFSIETCASAEFMEPIIQKLEGALSEFYDSEDILVQFCGVLPLDSKHTVPAAAAKAA